MSCCNKLFGGVGEGRSGEGKYLLRTKVLEATNAICRGQPALRFECACCKYFSFAKWPVGGAFYLDAWLIAAIRTNKRSTNFREAQGRTASRYQVCQRQGLLKATSFAMDLNDYVVVLCLLKGEIPESLCGDCLGYRMCRSMFRPAIGQVVSGIAELLGPSCFRFQRGRPSRCPLHHLEDRHLAGRQD